MHATQTRTANQALATNPTTALAHVLDAARNPDVEPTTIYTLLAHLWLLISRGAPAPLLSAVRPSVLDRLDARNGPVSFRIAQNDPTEPLAGYRLERQLSDSGVAYDVYDFQRYSPRQCTARLAGYIVETSAYLASKVIAPIDRYTAESFAPSIHALSIESFDVADDNESPIHAFSALSGRLSVLAREIAELQGSGLVCPASLALLEMEVDDHRARVRRLRWTY